MISLKLMTFLTIILLYLTSVAGQAKRASFNRDLVTYIDYEKYLENEGQRFRRQTKNIVNAIVEPVAPFNGYVPFQNFYYPRYNFPSNGFGPNPFPWYEFQNYGYNQQRYREPVSICADPVNEVYQECGSKCVLGCRYSNIRDARITAFESDCDKNVCVAGCFCKAGLVRHQSKCIPATECPIPKCQRNEVYQCGSAVPATCQNTLRMDEIVEQTENVDCIWGCSCANGYVRKNDSGQCIPKSDCLSRPIEENIDDSTRILGANSERHLFRPSNNPHYESCFGPSCKEQYQSTGNPSKPSKPKPGKPQVTISNHNGENDGSSSKPNKPSHHTHHASGSGNIAINNYNNFVNDPTFNATFIPYPVYPVYPYYPGNGTGGDSSSNAPNTINNNTITVTIPNNNSNSNNNNLTSSPIPNVTQGSGSSNSSTGGNPIDIVNNNTNTNNNDNNNYITITIPTNGSPITIPINVNNGGYSAGGITIPGTNITIPGISFPGTGAILNIPNVGVIIGTIIPGVQIPGIPGISLPNITIPSLPGINFPNLTLPSLPGINFPNLTLPSLPGINLPDRPISSLLPDRPISSLLSNIPLPSGNIGLNIPGLGNASVGTDGISGNIGLPGLPSLGLNLGLSDEDDTNTNQNGPSAPPMNIEFDPSNYSKQKPNRVQNSNKEPHIKTQTSTNRPNSMKNKKPNLTQYIPQPNAYANAAPNFFAQPTYFGANPFGQQYQYSPTPQYSNGYLDYPQNLQPNYQDYPPFRYQKRK